MSTFVSLLYAHHRADTYLDDMRIVSRHFYSRNSFKVYYALLNNIPSLPLCASFFFFFLPSTSDESVRGFVDNKTNYTSCEYSL